MLGIEGMLAHQGGWDEALVVIVPLALFGLLVWAAIVRSGHHAGGTGDRREGL